MTTRLIIIRHGQSVWNSDQQGDRFNGRTDIPLTDYGRYQATRIGQSLARFDVAAMYSSPLQRANTMARLIAEQCRLDVGVQHDLIEIDFGAWEGLSREEIIDRDGGLFWQWVDRPASVSAPGGESGYAVAARVVGALSRLIEAHRGQTFVVVAHKVVNRLALCHFMGLPLDQFRNLVPQRVGAMNIIEVDDGYKVCAIDDLSYLSADREAERY